MNSVASSGTARVEAVDGSVVQAEMAITEGTNDAALEVSSCALEDETAVACTAVT